MLAISTPLKIALFITGFALLNQASSVQINSDSTLVHSPYRNNHLALSRHYLANLDEMLASDYKEANRYSRLALTHANLHGDIPLRLLAYRKAAYLHYYYSNYKESMVYLLKKAQLADSVSNLEAIAWSYNYIGNVYYNIKELDKAVEYYQLCLSLYVKLGDSLGVGYMYNNLGNYHKSKGDFDESFNFYIKGLDIQSQIGSYKDVVILYNNIGNLIYKHKSDTTALSYFHKALEELPKVDDPVTHALVYVNMGDYFLWSREYQEALKYLTKGYSIANDNGLSSYTRDFSKSLAEVYAKLSNYTSAYKYQSIYSHLHDTLTNLNHASRFRLLDFHYQIEQDKYQQEISKAELKRKTRVSAIVMLGVVIISISLLVLLLVIYRSYKRKVRMQKSKLEMEKLYLEKQLELKNKEVVIKTMSLFERNELIRQVVNKLTDAKSLASASCESKLDNILSDLKAEYHDNVINEFDIRFKQVHEGFYTSIKTQHPRLSSNDLRLCAFLKMKLSTKDIALLTHQPLNSVHMARKRLRKKLSIKSSNIDLEEFVSQY